MDTNKEMQQEWNRAAFSLKEVGMPFAAKLSFDTAMQFAPEPPASRHARGCGCESCTGVAGGIDFLLWD